MRVNLQSSRYFEWQVRYFNYLFKKAGQQGHLTRILSRYTPPHPHPKPLLSPAS
jgi:hypothetical protein